MDSGKLTDVKKVVQRVLIWLLLTILLGYCIYATVKEKSDEYRIYFIDVGQGDSSLIVNGEHSVLIDCGDEEHGLYLSEFVKLYTDTLDCLVITHPHDDHAGGLSILAENLGIKQIITTDDFTTSGIYKDISTQISKNETEINCVYAGNQFEVGDIFLEVISPSEYARYEGENDRSLVIKATMGEKSVLFTGDIENEAEQNLCGGKYDLSADVLKVAHHGSDTSSSEEFLVKVSPSFAVISCGKFNAYSHPSFDVEERLLSICGEVYRTDEKGTVCFICDGKEIKPYKFQ